MGERLVQAGALWLDHILDLVNQRFLQLLGLIYLRIALRLDLANAKIGCRSISNSLLGAEVEWLVFDPVLLDHFHFVLLLEEVGHPTLLLRDERELLQLLFPMITDQDAVLADLLVVRGETLLIGICDYVPNIIWINCVPDIV